MPVYISRGRFTSDAIKGMLTKPENREVAVAKLFKSVGGKLIGWYLTFGHHDWLAIGEFPNEKAASCSSSQYRRGRSPLIREIPNGQPIMVAKGQVPPDELAAYALEEFCNGLLTIFRLSQHALDG